MRKYSQMIFKNHLPLGANRWLTFYLLFLSIRPFLSSKETTWYSRRSRVGRK